VREEFLDMPADREADMGREPGDQDQTGTFELAF
jgi:hypothetical protein